MFSFTVRPQTTNEIKQLHLFLGSQGWQTYIENNRDGNSLRPGDKNDRITYKGKSPGRVRVSFIAVSYSVRRCGGLMVTALNS